MDVKLKVLAGKHAGKEIPLLKPKFLIGRAEDCHLRAGSDLISRHHCQISVDDSTVTIKDFGGVNGTLLNEARVEGEQPLKSGDCLKIGPLEFEVVINARAPKQPVAVSTKAEAKAVSTTAAASNNVEDSISQWLGEPDVATQTRAMTDTQTYRMTSNTDHIPVKPQEEPEPSPEDSAIIKGKKEPGKLPPVPKTTTKDSREAAANILREMAKRR